MRIDHHAYQRGTLIAGFGFLLQFAIGLTLLIFGWISGDTTMAFAAWYVLLGTIVWVSLIVIFQQHKLERLEALEEDELAATRSGSSSVFEASADDQRVAARRLGLMHKWLMPAASLFLAGLLVLLAVIMGLGLYGYYYASEDAIDFLMTPLVGWGVALCLSIALVSFIFSRFVAGMAKLAAWQNLRGGAAYMVGNSLVMIAVAAGTAFRVFENDTVIFWVACTIPLFMVFVALEIILNFILNLYRPRIPGEVPRPAFDSRLLSLLAAPDSLVRTLNEAVDYQFGFDITSSWGYQLLLRSFLWLVALGVSVLVLLNMMVIVEPHQQAVKLSWGELVGDVQGPGIMWKLPWPFQSAEVYDVTTVRPLDLTARQLPAASARQLHLWTDTLRTNREFEPFLVGSTAISADLDLRDDDRFVRPEVEVIDDGPGPAPDEGEVEMEIIPHVAQPTEEDRAVAEVSQVFALLDAEIVLQYRIKHDEGESGLLDFLRFAPASATRRQGIPMREEALRALALREITQQLSRMSLDSVLAQERLGLAGLLRDRVQQAFDRSRTGVEVVAIDLPLIRPAGSTAERFEDIAMSNQARQQQIAIARRTVTTTLSYLAGDVATAMALLEQVEQYNALRDELGTDHPDAVELAAQIERDMVRTGGAISQFITQAERDRWVQLMEARAQASRTRGQQWAYRAAPELYRQREIMKVVMNTLSPVRKYVLGIDPGRVNIDVELKELSPLLDFSTAMGEGD